MSTIEYAQVGYILVLIFYHDVMRFFQIATLIKLKLQLWEYHWFTFLKKDNQGCPCFL
jgi:hypothetical protein